MVNTEYVERIEAPAAVVWEFVRWENLARMLPGGFFAAVTYDERRAVPGAKRRITLGDGASLLERLEATDPDGFHLVYRMLDTGPFPIADYEGSVRISMAGPNACFVRFASKCSPVGHTDEEWRAQYAQMQAANVAFIRSQVAG